VRRHLLHDHHQRDLLQGPRMLTTRALSSLSRCLVACCRQTAGLFLPPPVLHLADTCSHLLCFVLRIQSPKKFRLEWQPGPAGYVRWCVSTLPPPRPCCAVRSLTSPLIISPDRRPRQVHQRRVSLRHRRHEPDSVGDEDPGRAFVRHPQHGHLHVLGLPQPALGVRLTSRLMRRAVLL
jgi:hypothetical protein